MKHEPSAFDSRHYDLRIGRLVPEAGDGAAELERALAAAPDHDVLFLRLSDRDPLCGVLAQRGETPVDTLVTSQLGAERRAARIPDGIAIEHADHIAGHDLDAIAAITADSITTSHLHADPRLPLARTRALYAAWARNDATGRAQRVIVARAAGEVAGFITVLVRGGTAVIDLVAVARAHQGNGLGSALLADFVAWVDAERLAAQVGTQAHNRALALYARHGFVPYATDLTYHLWST